MAAGENPLTAHPAASGTRLSPHCVGHVRSRWVFSLTDALPSTTSTKACAPLFGGFIGTIASCDSSEAYMRAVRPQPSPAGPPLFWRTSRRSPGSRAYSCSACLGSTTTRDHSPARVNVGVCVAFPIRKQGRHPDLRFSELNTQPTDPSVYASTAASRLPPQDSRPGGSLLLSCKALASSTACRFIPAHFLTPFPPESGKKFDPRNWKLAIWRTAIR